MAALAFDALVVESLLAALTLAVHSLLVALAFVDLGTVSLIADMASTVLDPFEAVVDPLEFVDSLVVALALAAVD